MSELRDSCPAPNTPAHSCEPELDDCIGLDDLAVHWAIDLRSAILPSVIPMAIRASSHPRDAPYAVAIRSEGDGKGQEFEFSIGRTCDGQFGKFAGHRAIHNVAQRSGHHG